MMYDLLEELVGEVHLAHPLKVKAIAEARIKTDKIDPEVLAHLLRWISCPKPTCLAGPLETSATSCGSGCSSSECAPW